MRIKKIWIFFIVVFLVIASFFLIMNYLEVNEFNKDDLTKKTTISTTIKNNKKESKYYL